MKTKNLIIGIAVLVVLLMGGFFLLENKNSITGNVISDNVLEGDSEKVTIYFFWGDGCPHCATEKPFLESLEKKYLDKIEVKMFETWKNKDNAELFREVAKAHGISARGVPTTFIGEKNWVGYADYMNEEIEDYVKYCIENKCENLANSCFEDICSVPL